MRLALFDLDNTLLAGDSDFEWAQYLIEQGVLDREVYEARNQGFYDQYKAGTLDIHEFLDFQLKPLSRHPRAQLDAWHRDFMARKIIPIIAPGAAELLRRHADHVQVIVTATNSFVTGPIAAHLGVPHLIATEPERLDDGFTGRPFGTPSFRRARSPAWSSGWRHGASPGPMWRKAGSTATPSMTCPCWPRCITRWPWTRTRPSRPTPRNRAGP
jgi:phosphoserine phosphatase